MNVYLLTTLTYPKKNPSPCQGLGFAEGQKKSWPLPLPFLSLPFTLRVGKPLHITTKDNQVGNGNGVPGQEDEESGETEKEDWVLTIILDIDGKEGKFEWT